MTGEAGFPGFKASQVRWVSFLQSRLRRQFDSAVLAEPAGHSLSWAEPMICC